jgi:hypothetical protein
VQQSRITSEDQTVHHDTTYKMAHDECGIKFHN